MIKEIRLQHYRQHENRTVQFGPGINAIRAANGMGKSKMLESINYALFGARALAEALEDVVTRGSPVGKLKVEVDISHMGVDYTFARGKSGAEVRAGGKVLVTGQTECTKFAESLFGANADMASKLMIAKQKQLGGALTGGAAKASEMIEFLADFDLFDRIVGLIQTKLPCGATSSVEARIALLASQSAEAVLADLVPLQNAVLGAQASLEITRGQVKTLQTQLDTLDVAAAHAILAERKQLQANIDGRVTPLGRLQASLAAALPEAPPAGALDLVREKIEAQKKLVAAEKLLKELQAAPISVLWDEPFATLEAEIAKTAAAAVAARDQHTQDSDAIRATELELTQLKSNDPRRAMDTALGQLKASTDLQRAELQGKLVKEETCAFCGKDLKDVPEVALVNNPLYDQLTQLEADWGAAKERAEVGRAQLETEWLAAQEQLAGKLQALQADAAKSAQAQHDAKVYADQLNSVVLANQKAQLLYAKVAEYVALDESVVPARWTWTGPTDEPKDFSAELAALEAQDRAATGAVAARAEQQQQLADLKAQQQADESKLAGLLITDAEETLQLEAGLKPKIAEARAAIEVAADAAAVAEAALTTARMANQNAQQNQANAKQQLVAVEAEMAEMQENNALVKKIRAAKPQVIDQLWAMALAATSRYGSQMRGEQWVVTRADGEFRVNGFPAAGLSGAEEDLLGLAIRVALTKLFLPNTPFMILDEVAAACDDQREMAMLGLLSTLDFDQIILVTHSELADSFANQIITL